MNIVCIKSRMSSNSLQILKSLLEENINMYLFLLVPYPYLCSGKGINLRKYIVSFKLEQNFILMKEEKAFVDFITTMVLILSFSGFYTYKNVHDEEIT